MVVRLEQTSTAVLRSNQPDPKMGQVERLAREQTEHGHAPTGMSREGSEWSRAIHIVHLAVDQMEASKSHQFLGGLPRSSRPAAWPMD